MANNNDVLDAILRIDFGTFIRKSFNTLLPGETFEPNWHIEAIAHRLERVRHGEIKRLIINMPPRSLKSICASVAFPAFLLGHNPSERIICASYAGDLAKKLSNDFRSLVDTPWYKRLFPRTRIAQKNSETEIEFTKRGFRMATSVGGVITGRGGNIVIIDDPLKPDEAMSDARREGVNQWFNNTLLSRLDDKRTGAIIVVMQRLHIDDLTGFLLRQDDWDVLTLPAIATVDEEIPISSDRTYFRRMGEPLSPRDPIPVLETMKRALGSDVFSAQYQQEPVPPGGNMIKRDWIQRYIGLPSNQDQLTVVQSWDTAAKGGPDNDWSACTTWVLTKDHRWYLTHVWRDRVDYPRLKEMVKSLAKQHGAKKVLIEEAGTAIALLAELRREVPGIIGIKPQGDKQARMSVVSSKFEAGQVYFPERAHWLADLETELFAFPAGRHDDQCDSISQALSHNSWPLYISPQVLENMRNWPTARAYREGRFRY